MEAVELCQAILGCAMPASHRLAALRKVTAADVEQEVLISFAEDTRLGSAVREALRRRNIVGRITFTVNQTFSAGALAQAGAGVGLVDPFPLLMGAFLQLVNREFKPSIQTRARTLISSSRPTSLITRRFEHMLAEVSDEFTKRRNQSDASSASSPGVDRSAKAVLAWESAPRRSSDQRGTTSRRRGSTRDVVVRAADFRSRSADTTDNSRSATNASAAHSVHPPQWP
ncbi:MAG: LysR substrate-binding domain-containing protein [Bordetella sp.]|nr:LysR substrate-binding domain-containing protein [Bordetella sp.]